MAFAGTRIRDAVHPEFLGIGTYLGASVLAASLDAAVSERVKGYPVAQTTTTVGSFGGGLVSIGYGKAVDFSKGLVYGSGAGMLITAARGLWEMAKSERVRTRMTDVAALIPRKVGGGLSEAERRRIEQQRSQLEARRRASLSQGQGASVPTATSVATRGSL